MKKNILCIFLLPLFSTSAFAVESPPKLRPPLEIKWNNDSLNREAPLPSSFSMIAKAGASSVVRLAIARDEIWAKENEKKIPTLFLDPEMESNPKSRSFGSGIVLDRSGVILTNAHVVENTTTCEIFVGESGDSIPGKVIAVDSASDLALVQVQSALVPAVFTKERPLLGDFVLALGNPEGVGMTLTKGIVSATNRSRSWQRSNARGSFIQIDALILPGNSGGALLDLKGRVIGINSWYLPQGYGKIGFAFPTEQAMKIAQDLWQYGHVRYGYLGVRLGVMDSERFEELKVPEGTRGIVVLSVEMDLAGDQAGLRAGDVITRLDDYHVRDVAGFADILKLREVGSMINLHVIREGVPRTLTATLGLRPIPQPQKK